MHTEEHYKVLDSLATLLVASTVEGEIVWVNTGLEDTLAVSRRSLVGASIVDWVLDGPSLLQALHGVQQQQMEALRFDGVLRRTAQDTVPMHVLVTRSDDADILLIEFVPLEQLTRQEREERQAEQAQSNKELVRNLAHEIKNPLGGIRGAAQLLDMEIESSELKEYTRVIIHEADRLQSLVDRLLAPHRKPHVVGDVNIHEVCERVRSLVLAEFPRGLSVVRDYDISLPEFRGDREQLIQTVLNITHNACQALAERIAQAQARIVFKTRVARQVTFGKQRYPLALELHVIDNGPGVPDSIKDRIFYPLVSGREGGSGLGLTLAQTFVQQHHGSIEVDSEPGCTDFKILIPLP